MLHTARHAAGEGRCAASTTASGFTPPASSSHASCRFSGPLPAISTRSPGQARCARTSVAGMVALWATQFVQGRTADSYRTATRALNLTDPESELSGQAHFAVGGSAVSLGMPAEGLSHLELAAKLAGVMSG